MSGEKKIKILPGGPYEVSGGIPLKEKIIAPQKKSKRFEEGRSFETEEPYHLCRCGKSKNKPFCDGSHAAIGFEGTEVASKAPYEERAEVQKGPGLDLADDGRCAFARFCHAEDGVEVWTLTDMSDDPENANKVRKHATACPAGRLTVIEKDGTRIEPQLPQEISILQDPERGVSSGIYVQGGIPLEGADGELYEQRNRYMLCRCGYSRNKPFCDATHVPMGFDDKK